MLRENGNLVRLSDQESDQSWVTLQDDIDPPRPLLNIPFQAVYDCVADDIDELSFKAGDIIVVVEEIDDSWWVRSMMTQTRHFHATFAPLSLFGLGRYIIVIILVISLL